MLKLTKKGDYGLLLATALAKAEPNQFIPLSQVAKDYSIPYKFLTQIALDLKNSSIIESKEGVGGGYRLARQTEDINVKDILIALEGPIQPTGCMKGKVCKCQSVCKHKNVMQSLVSTVTSALESFTLAQMVAE